MFLGDAIECARHVKRDEMWPIENQLLTLNYTVSQKTAQNCFCQNFVKFPPILIIFGTKMAKRLKLCAVYSFSTSTNLRHHTAVLNADVPNCYTML